MFLTEKFNQDTQRKLWNWGQFDCYKLKHKYKNEHEQPVTTIKLSKEELEEYLIKRGYKNGK